MFAYLKGLFVQKTPSKVVVDVNGVGYDVQISIQTYEHIVELEKGTLYTYLHITENGQTLFGFFDEKEKEMFLHLISVSGVGAATARMMLSSMKQSEIAKYIVQSNLVELVKIKGIGKKTAELLVVSLRDKLVHLLNDDNQAVSSTPINGQNSDAVIALVALGIAKPMAEKAVQKVIFTNSNLSLQDIIKQALKNI
ncbi:MAG: Holliday junction branch migration protein RuvA [Chitinophagaceae bacterium]